MNIASLASRVQPLTAHPSFSALAIAGLGISLLAGAYAFEYLGGIKPCPLCLEQRIPWVVLIGLGGGAFAAQTMKAPKPLALTLLGLAVVVALYGAYLGGYHAGIEYRWWLGPAECSGGGVVLPTEGGAFDGISTSEIVRCDTVAWSLLGVSLAGFNFLFSLGAAALAATGVLRGVR